RAWVLCQDEFSKSLILPFVFLCFTLLSVLVTIGLRIAITVISISQHVVITHRGLARALDYCQGTNLVLSLLTNVFRRRLHPVNIQFTVCIYWYSF
ncbi:hypothetical protein DFS33DRAFT_1257738, partial [Desarmillaria ectypa]